MDEIGKAFALLSSLKQNTPNNYEVDQSWVNDFHSALQQIEIATGTSLQEFRISQQELKREVSSSNYLDGTVDYSGRMVIERSRLLLKVDAALAFFQYVRDKPTKGKLGFSKS